MKPALRRTDRDDHTLQFGVHPRRAVMLTGLTQPVRRWIDGLDGTRDLARVLKEAAAAGLDEVSARSLLDQLIQQGVLHDAGGPPLPLPLPQLDRLRPDLDALDLASSTPDGGRQAMLRRGQAQVRVYGAGRVGAQVVALLAAAGVGTIRVIDPGPTLPRDITPGGLTWSELGLSRQDGAVALARRITGSPAASPTAHPTGSATASPAPSGRGRRPAASRERADQHGPTVDARAGGPPLSDRSQRPDLVILTPVRPLDRVLVNELFALGIPHLLAAAFEGHGCVGPLVLPGQTACLHCLDLARRDRDPAWPIVTARLGGFPPGEIACDAVLASMVAAAAAGHALAHIDGREAVVTNGTMDVFPDWHWKRRSWDVHPQCRCMRNNPNPLTMVMSATCD
ncbi:thiamine biosynthesis protein ThiF [Nonomuraea sp. LPB2021202275-12-8]|uniref:thiamine biosynthesis protein ThiF n=1 Tax=Nonomuraea sp. LPB2021202275-12-8 TaxID=3120159 RepID=UPI00300D6CCF